MFCLSQRHLLCFLIPDMLEAMMTRNPAHVDAFWKFAFDQFFLTYPPQHWELYNSRGHLWHLIVMKKAVSAWQSCNLIHV